MIETVAQCKFGVRSATVPIHWLQKEMPEGECFKLAGFRSGLGIYQLQFITAHLRQFRSSLGADADPIQACRSGNCPIGFDGNFKVEGVKRLDQDRVDLQQWLSAGANHESLPR